MSTVVGSLPAKGVGIAVYPWDEWFDGRAHALRRGVDFHCAPSDFAPRVHTAARRRGLRVSTRWHGDELTLQAARASRDAERMRRRRERLRAAGLCISCGDIPATPYARCKPCRQSNLESVKRSQTGAA
jgi:hypothetical protein